MNQGLLKKHPFFQSSSLWDVLYAARETSFLSTNSLRARRAGLL